MKNKLIMLTLKSAMVIAIVKSKQKQCTIAYLLLKQCLFKTFNKTECT